jgi:hypothetical protein
MSRDDDFISIAQEQAFLGSVLQTPEIYRPGLVDVTDFTTSLNRNVYRHLSESDERGIEAVVAGLRAQGKIQDPDIAIISGMLDGVLSSTMKGLERMGAGLRELTQKRQTKRIVTSMNELARRGQVDDLAPPLSELQRVLSGEGRASVATIHKLSDIPDVLGLDLPTTEWLVPGLIARNHITLWAGKGGCGKSVLALRIAHTVTVGGEFLERKCKRGVALVIDFENAGSTVRDRLTDMDLNDAPDLHIWGNWLPSAPPLIGSPALLEIAKQERPLIIVDPLRLAYTGDENDAGVMAEVMRHLRALAATGSAVVVVHHIGRGEGSTFRGSSVIRDLIDIHILQEQTPEGLITLRTEKARIGEPLNITVSADWDTYSFTVTDDPVIAKRKAEEDKLAGIIREMPGMTQTELAKKMGGRKGRVFQMLRDGNERRWISQSNGKKNLYYPIGSRILGTGREPMEPVIPAVQRFPGSPLIGEPGTGTGLT